jgi:hypothetical protein
VLTKIAEHWQKEWSSADKKENCEPQGASLRLVFVPESAGAAGGGAPALFRLPYVSEKGFSSAACFERRTCPWRPETVMSFSSVSRFRAQAL